MKLPIFQQHFDLLFDDKILIDYLFYYYYNENERINLYTYDKNETDIICIDPEGTLHYVPFIVKDNENSCSVVLNEDMSIEGYIIVYMNECINLTNFIGLDNKERIKNLRNKIIQDFISGRLIKDLMKSWNNIEFMEKYKREFTRIML